MNTELQASPLPTSTSPLPLPLPLTRPCLVIVAETQLRRDPQWPNPNPVNASGVYLKKKKIDWWSRGRRSKMGLRRRSTSACGKRAICALGFACSPPVYGSRVPAGGDPDGALLILRNEELSGSSVKWCTFIGVCYKGHLESTCLFFLILSQKIAMSAFEATHKRMGTWKILWNRHNKNTADRRNEYWFIF